MLHLVKRELFHGKLLRFLHLDKYTAFLDFCQGFPSGIWYNN